MMYSKCDGLVYMSVFIRANFTKPIGVHALIGRAHWRKHSSHIESCMYAKH